MFGHDDKKDKQDEGSELTGSPPVTPDPSADGVLDDGAVQTDTAEPLKGLPFTPPTSNPEPPAPAPAADDNNWGGGNGDDLLLIKQQALQQLSPLVDHLDQTPEEKFKTTMMMIQASDDEKLVKEAFDAAKEIKDDKVRAQALLDVINEINYFTQQSSEN